MQYSFLGFSVSKMMDFNLDMKDVAILRYFVNFKDTGRMNTEVAYGEIYYWINYKSMEEEMPYLGLSKRAIMTRMLRLRDLGILNHYTKKEGGTFSFFTLGSKYIELINSNNNKISNKEEKEFNKREYKNRNNKYKNKVNKNILSITKENIKGDIKENINKDINEDINEDMNEEINKDINEDIKYENEDIQIIKERKSKKVNIEENEEEAVLENVEGVLNSTDNIFNYKYGVFKNEERVFSENVEGDASKGRTKTLLLNNSSTKETNIKKYIKKEIEEYPTPFTLFGLKFEQYLNQKIVSQVVKSKNNERSKLRFDNFKGRDYDYDELERKLLGWE